MRLLKGGPPPAEGINAARPLPRKRGQERGNSHSLLRPRLRPRSRLSLMKTSKKVTDSHTHARQTQAGLRAEHGVATERDEDVKSLTAAIRLGGSETRQQRQKAARGERTERMRDVNRRRGRFGEKRNLKLFFFFFFNNAVDALASFLLCGAAPASAWEGWNVSLCVYALNMCVCAQARRRAGVQACMRACSLVSKEISCLRLFSPTHLQRPVNILKPFWMGLIKSGKDN